MIELVTRDCPDVVCLQELPVWALRHLESWSGMHAATAIARRPLLPVGARAVTAFHHGLLRSAFAGEGDAILTRAAARDLGEQVVGETKPRRIGSRRQRRRGKLDAPQQRPERPLGNARVPVARKPRDAREPRRGRYRIELQRHRRNGRS
jgi:hypothetical protein